MSEEELQALYDLRDALYRLAHELGIAADICERVARKGGRNGLYGDLGNSGIGGKRAAGDSIADHKN